MSLIHQYFERIRDFKLVNLESQLKNPTLIRIDINSPVINGRISENNLRLQVYAHLLELYSDYSGLIVLSHQGRPGQSDFISLKQHWVILRKLLPSNKEIEFISKDSVFTEKTKQKLKALKRDEIVLIDNVRMFDEEFNFDPENSKYIEFFREIANCCINDSIPTWHRNHASLMCLPYIARTYIGIRSAFEFKVLHNIVVDPSEKVLIMGGAKLQKANYIHKIAKRNCSILTGGLVGQLIARIKGYDLGERNNELLDRRFKAKEFEEAKILCKRIDIRHPVDFVVLEDGENRNIPIEEMRSSKGIIMDVGPETVDLYSKICQEKEIRIRAGPLGKFEHGYSNGIKLTKKIAGDGLIFLGGDTSQEVINFGIYQHIVNSGGLVLISGGSFIHGMADERFPPLDILIKQSSVSKHS